MCNEMSADALKSLAAAALVRRCDPASIPFETTAAFDAPFSIVGQARAAEALAFGIGVAHEGYNVFVMGPAGSGKRTLVQDTLAGRAAGIAPPSDWVLVNNFAVAHRPIAIELPAGRGAGFNHDMVRLVEELRATIPAIFESEEYVHRVEQIDTEFTERHEKTLAALGQDAAREGIALLRTPTGFTFAPLKGGRHWVWRTLTASPRPNGNGSRARSRRSSSGSRNSCARRCAGGTSETNGCGASTAT